MLACSNREDELRREAVAALAKADNQAVQELVGRIHARAADSFSDKKANARVLPGSLQSLKR